MKKLCLFLLLIPIQLNAQFSLDSFTTTNQILVENSIKQCLFISKQSFQIQDTTTKEVFGLGGKNTFDISYTIGIKVSGGCIISNEALNPWNHSKKFIKYKDSYRPLLFESSYSDLSTTPQFINLVIDNNVKQTFGDSLFFKLSTDCFNSLGFELDSNTGRKNGWIVWIINKQGQNLEETTELDYIVSQKNIQIDKNTSVITEGIVTPKTNGVIIGGIFIVPYYGMGNITFKLCGILSGEDKTWALLTPFATPYKENANQSNDSLSNSNSKQKDDDILTPIINE